MPCDTRLLEDETLAQREVKVKKALTRLEAALTNGQAKVVIGPRGEVAFQGWKKEDRDGMSDACTYRLLSAQNSWALRQAVAKAEALAGKKVNPHAVAGGSHSHDGGKTWHKD